MRRVSLAFFVAVATLLAVSSGASAATSTFTNAAPITIPAGAPGTTEGPAAPYPSTISVSGLPNPVLKARATLLGVAHTYPTDIQVLLAGPGGQKTILMKNACGGDMTPLTGENFTFDDAAAPMPQLGPCPSGTYRPSDLPPFVEYPTPPAPPPPHAVALATFNGTAPNGTWQLFVFDSAGGDVGSISGGWRLELEHPALPTTAIVCRGQAATISGTERNDALVGTPGADVIAGLGGNDNLAGLGGNDVICGAKGNDTLRGGPGADTLLGQQGNDNLLGNTGKDKLSGKKGNDRLKGAGGKDKLKGGGGRDTCIGGKASDFASKCEVEKSV